MFEVVYSTLNLFLRLAEWLVTPLFCRDWFIYFGAAHLFSFATGMFGWLILSHRVRIVQWRKTWRFVFCLAQPISFLAILSYGLLGAIFIVPIGLIMILHGLCLASAIRAFTSLGAVSESLAGSS